MEHFDLHKIEKKESLEMGCEKLFNALHPDTFLGFNKKFSKKEFLDWVIANKNIVLHGSNNQYISTFEPRLANCNSKEYGNQKGIYATEDTILPMFYAIKDKDRFDGIADSGRYENDNKEKGYHFSISKDMIDKKPWSSGAIYLFDKSNFISKNNTPTFR